MRLKISNIEGTTLLMLSSGNHVLGRSSVLECNDKRISRNHATITVDKNEAILSATHINPTYYKAAGSNHTVTLKEPTEVQLHNGDKFGFLADNYWYKIELIMDFDDTRSTDSLINQSKHEAKRCTEEAGHSNGSLAKRSKPNELETTLDESFQFFSTAVVPEHNNQTTVDLNEATDIDNIETTVDPSEATDIVKSEEVLHDPSIDITDDNKEGIVDSVSEQTTLPDNQPSTSGDNKQQIVRRERCWYGASCYRKNPAHLQEFSHPDNPDYASDPDDDRPSCVYGAQCYRRNRLHRQDYKHPTGPMPRHMLKRKRTTKAKKPKKPQDADELSDDNDYDYDDPFIDDSDEYEASSDDTEDDPDWDDSGKVEEDSEDVKELLKEAKHFTKDFK